MCVCVCVCVCIPSPLDHSYIPIRMAKIQNTDSTKCCQGCEQQEQKSSGNEKIVQLLWEIVWQFLKKLNIKLPYNLAVALLCIYLREIKTPHIKT